MKKYVTIKNAQWSNAIDIHSAMLAMKSYGTLTSRRKRFLITVGLYSYIAIGLTIILFKTSQYILR